MSGTLLQAFAFVAAAKLVAHVSISPDPLIGRLISQSDRTAGFIGVGLIALLISFAGAILYKSRRHAIRLAADFETERYAEGLRMVRHAELGGAPLSPSLKSELQNQSPRFMGRMLMALLSGIPAAITATLAFIASLLLNFSLTALLAVGILLLSPLFLRFILYSSQTSRQMKDAAPGFSISKKAFLKEILAAPIDDAETLQKRITQEAEYQNFLEAYQMRLALAPFTQFLNAVSLSVALVIVFLWFVLFKNAQVESLTNLLISLVLLRFFMQGLNVVMSVMTLMSSFYPFFSNFITISTGQYMANTERSNTDATGAYGEKDFEADIGV
ncbi:MAG: hypothetical protein ACFB00_01030 [Parvularculaceae bacterium]